MSQIKHKQGTSLVAQWLRIRLPMQGTWVRSLVLENPTWAEQLSLCATTTEACMPRTRAPQQEKPPQWEARAPQRRVAPACLQLEKAIVQQQRPNTAKTKNKKQPYANPVQ